MNIRKREILIIIITFLTCYNGFSQIKRENQCLSKASVHLGLGFSYYNLGKLTNDYISNPIGPSFNVNFSINKFIMIYSVNLSSSTVISEKVLIDTIELNKNDKFKFLTISASFGYNYRPNNWLQINPFVGIIYSDILIKENQKNPTIVGLTSGINTQLILNPDNVKGNFIYVFFTTRLNWKSFKEINPDFNNITFCPEIGIAYRFISR